MGTLTRRRRGALQLMMAELMMIASWETIARRSLPMVPAHAPPRIPAYGYRKKPRQYNSRCWLCCMAVR